MSYSQSTTTSANTAPVSGPLFCTDVDLSKIDYSDIVPGKSNPSFKSVYMNYSGGNLMLQTPWLKTWDGICAQPEEYRTPGAPLKYSINFTLAGRNDGEVAAFKEFLRALDDKIITDVAQNCQTWLKKKLSKEVCDAFYTKQLRLAKDKETGEFTDKYPASFKSKVPCYDGQWKCQLFNDKQEEMTGDLSTHLTGKCEVRAILKCGGIWFVNDKFGVTWNAHCLEYRSTEVAPQTGYQFRRTADDENVGSAVVAGAGVVHREIVDNGDDGDEAIEDSDME